MEWCDICQLIFFLQLLKALELFDGNLDDYLHLLLPPVVKLFDNPENPIHIRR